MLIPMPSITSQNISALWKPFQPYVGWIYTIYKKLLFTFLPKSVHIYLNIYDNSNISFYKHADLAFLVSFWNHRGNCAWKIQTEPK